MRNLQNTLLVNFFCLFVCLFVFKWRKIALQCLDGFCHTTMWHRHNYTHIPSLWSLPSDTSFHPSRKPQCQTRLPVLYSNFPPAIYFTHDGVYISKLLSPPSHPLLPLLCSQVYFLHLHLHSFPENRFIITIFYRFHIYALIYNICFSLSDWRHSV